MKSSSRGKNVISNNHNENELIPTETFYAYKINSTFKQKILSNIKLTIKIVIQYQTISATKKIQWYFKDIKQALQYPRLFSLDVAVVSRPSNNQSTKRLSGSNALH